MVSLCDIPCGGVNLRIDDLDINISDNRFLMLRNSIYGAKKNMESNKEYISTVRVPDFRCICNFYNIIVSTDNNRCNITIYYNNYTIYGAVNNTSSWGTRIIKNKYLSLDEINALLESMNTMLDKILNSVPD